MYTTDYMDEQFINEFKRYAEQSHLCEGTLTALNYCNATVLPFLDNRGGVLNEHGKYIEDSALKAENLMEGAYDTKFVKHEEKRVIYLGCFIKHWGHFLVDFVPRLWYLIDNDCDLNLVYVSMNGKRIDGVYANLLELFGINIKKLTYVDEPMCFSEVIIPQTSFCRPLYFYKEYGDIFRHIVKKLNEQKLSFPHYDKIYWTRTHLRKARRTEIGEKQIEKLFKANGYKVLAPEKLSLVEQVHYFSTCRQMAGISGSIPHNLVFSNSDTEMIILNKTYRINTIQFSINEMCGAKVTYVDCHASFFPNSPDKGPYWLVYNQNLEKFAQDHCFNIPPNLSKTKGKVKRSDFIRFSITYFNTYTGLEVKKVDAGMAGEIVGRSRAKAEGVAEHEIYYYYRCRMGDINSLMFLESNIKKIVRGFLRK